MSRPHIIRTIFIGLVLVAISPAGPAQTLLVHLPFDGSTQNLGSAGATDLYVDDGGAPPGYVPGRVGQALALSSRAVLAVPYSLDLAVSPRITVTAWVREPEDASGSRTLVSSGSDAGVRVAADGGRLAARLGSHGERFDAARLPSDDWAFVAVVMDYSNSTLRLYQDGVPDENTGFDTVVKPPRLFDNPAYPELPPQAYVFVGGNDFRTWGATSRPLLVDDLRVYADALDAAQLQALRDQAGNTQFTAGATPSGQLPLPLGASGINPDAMPALTDAQILAIDCDSHDACPSGSYCAVEGKCHPNRHKPLSDIQIVEQTVTLQTLPTAETGEEPGGSTADGGAPPRTGTPVPVGDPVLTSRSGFAGDVARTVDLVDSFMSRIFWREEADRPCIVTVRSGDTGDAETLSLPGCGAVTVERDNTGFVELQLADEPDTAVAIGQLQVCNNANDNKRLKGLRIWGDRINSDGSTTYIPNSDEDTMPNCARWRTSVLCGPGYAATGLVVHATNASGNNQQITGLQMICRRIGLE
jgi:hypothetical protein